MVADDPSTWRMMSFSYRWGFGSMSLVNVYPFITPSQESLWRWRRSWKPKQHTTDGHPPWGVSRSTFAAWLHNMDVAREELRQADAIVAAWGNLPQTEDLEAFLDQALADYDAERMEMTKPFRSDWKCLGHTKDGHPTHPMARGKHRVPSNAALIEWRE